MAATRAATEQATSMATAMGNTMVVGSKYSTVAIDLSIIGTPRNKPDEKCNGNCFTFLVKLIVDFSLHKKLCTAKSAICFTKN